MTEILSFIANGRYLKRVAIQNKRELIKTIKEISFNTGIPINKITFHHDLEDYNYTGHLRKVWLNVSEEMRK